MKPKTYNPPGLVTSKPINLRLMRDELLQADQVAAAAGISKSNLARQAYLKGLPLVIADFSPAAVPPSAAFSGGAASATPAGLSIPQA